MQEPISWCVTSQHERQDACHVGMIHQVAAAGQVAAPSVLVIVASSKTTLRVADRSFFLTEHAALLSNPRAAKEVAL